MLSEWRKGMKIAVRLDDITPDMDWKKFLAFKELLDNHCIRPLIGVVPENKDSNLCCDAPRSDFWHYIKDLQKQGWVIAMHGYRHVYDSNRGGMFPLNNFAEFAGHPLKVQEEKIREGKRLFAQKGLETDMFMAPAHAYDRNTLKALKENGFTRITDGFGNRPYYWEGMVFYPISFRLANSLKQKQGYTTMVVHTNTIENMDDYKLLFEAHRDKFMDYSEYMNVRPKKQTGFGRKKEYLLANVKRRLVKLAGQA